MPDYTPIPDATVDPDAPITSELMYRLRDNPLAIAEGAAGAPRLRAGFNATAPASGGVLVVPQFGTSGSPGARRFYAFGSGSVRITSTPTVISAVGALIVYKNDVAQAAAGSGENLNFVLEFTFNDIIRFSFESTGSITVDTVSVRSTTLSGALIPWQ